MVPSSWAPLSGDRRPEFRWTALLRVALLVPLVLAGCTLVDQRTFDPTAGLPPTRPKPPAPPAPLAPPLPGPPPLLSVRLPAPAELRADLARAVAQAKARKPGVAFDVVEITPDAKPGAEAVAIAQDIVTDGIPAARVSLAVRPIPAVAHEIRIFVH